MMRKHVYTYIGEVPEYNANRITAKHPCIVVTGRTESGHYELAVIDASNKLIDMLQRAIKRNGGVHLWQ